MRTSKSDLDQLVRVLNNRLGRPQYSWTRVGTNNVCAVGAMTIESDGSRLFEVASDGGGLYERSPRLSSGELAQYIRAMLQGIDLAEVNIRSAAPHLDGLPGWGETPDQDGPHGRTSPRAKLTVGDVWG